jgi:hypothetical protein
MPGTAALALSGLAAIACLASAPAGAQALGDKYWVEVGAYWADVSSKARIEPDHPLIPGTTIDFESDLDLDDSEALPSITAGTRLGGRWSIEAEYYSLGREGTRQAGRTIRFDDVVFDVNARVDAKFVSDVYRLTVGYAFLRTKDAELGGAIGVHGTDFEVSLAGEASLNGTPVVGGVIRRKKMFIPLPTVGVFGTVQVAPRVTVNARVDYLSLSIDRYAGRLLNAQASVSYRVTSHLDIGAMWRSVDYRLDVERDRWQGRVRYQFNGPELFARLAF